jgi:hypothetical protein
LILGALASEAENHNASKTFPFTICVGLLGVVFFMGSLLVRAPAKEAEKLYKIHYKDRARENQ